MRNKNIISAIDTIWRSIENKINPGIKIKDYGKFTFNSDIDLPLNTIIEFRSLLINVSCVIEKDISEGIDIKKCKETSRECSLCKFYYF